MASLIIVVAVFALDVAAFALAIAAEHHRSTAVVMENKAKTYEYCVYSSDVATGYGVGALVLLVASQAVVMAASRCFCCGRALRPGRWRAYAGVCFIACWFTFVIAELCLLAGSARNAYHTRYTKYFRSGPLPCATVRKGVFGAGAAFVFLTALLTELHYLFYSKARDAPPAPPLVKDPPGIGMTRI